MANQIEVLFTPAEFRALRERDLSDSVCVVFDVLRATSSIVTALANGAAAVIPVEEIPKALALHRERPDFLLAGERNGLRIGPALAGGIEFDLGNSPREFTAEKIRGKTIVSTTTNGTRALRACVTAREIVVGSFLNLSATANHLVRQAPGNLFVVCAGTAERAAIEDVLAAGALCELIAPRSRAAELLDSARIAQMSYQHKQSNLSDAVSWGRNGRRLLANAELRDDVAFCLRRDCYDIVPILGQDGVIRKSP